ncbi:MAG: methylmalonyl-CoA epimerase [Candidatus Eremiobacteraeota bacterium]|nr:methylmalonyl-CoA epimerase [Candidatus Eremiobacteraeota bacterium]MBV8282508.1 methylmalonyl-CoA epimerase [Candidatus Eremiobacteraeota bacterium]
MTSSPAGAGQPLDHVALVVADLGRSAALYSALGFTERYRETVDDQDVEIIGMRAGDSTIELLRPLSATSPLVKFLGGKESRLHHLAYRVADIEAELERLKRAGVRLIDERPRKGAHGNLIAFIHPSAAGDVLIEVCQPAS